MMMTMMTMMMMPPIWLSIRLFSMRHTRQGRTARDPGPSPFFAAVAVGSTVGSPSRNGCRKNGQKAPLFCPLFSLVSSPLRHPFSAALHFDCTGRDYPALHINVLTMLVKKRKNQ